jgi:hypothetical protein
MVGLDAASKIPDPANVPDALNAAIAQAAFDLKSRNDTYYKLFRALIGITTSLTIFLGLIAVPSLTFVLKVRKRASSWLQYSWILNNLAYIESQWHQKISNSVFVSVEHRTIAENADGTVDTNPSTLAHPPAAARPVTQHLGPPTATSFAKHRETAKSKAKVVSQQEKDIIALHRLARDLSISTPCILVLIAFSVVSPEAKTRLPRC